VAAQNDQLVDACHTTPRDGAFYVMRTEVAPIFPCATLASVASSRAKPASGAAENTAK